MTRTSATIDTTPILRLRMKTMVRNPAMTATNAPRDCVNSRVAESSEARARSTALTGVDLGSTAMAIARAAIDARYAPK